MCHSSAFDVGAGADIDPAVLFFFWKAELSLTSFSVFFMPGSTVINDPLLFLLLNSIVLAHQVYLSVIVYVCIKCKRLCYK